MGNNLRGVINVKATMSAFALSFYGKIETAYAMSGEAVQAAEVMDAHTKGLAYSCHGSVCFFKGDFELACRFLTEAFELCCKSGHLLWREWGDFWLANTYYFTQCQKEAIKFYTRMISSMNDKEHSLSWLPVFE